MTSVLAFQTPRQAETSRVRPAQADSAAANAAKLTGVLQAAFGRDGDVLHLLLARILQVHMRSPHEDSTVNGDIRDRLDEIQLLISLEIESEGLLQVPDDRSISPAQPCSAIPLVTHITTNPIPQIVRSLS